MAGITSLVRSPLLSLLAFVLTRWSNSYLLNAPSDMSASRYIHSALTWTFAAFFIFSSLFVLNRKLSDLAHNKWLWDPKEDPLMRFAAETKKWNWPEELAVITGGSDGIGSYVVEGLASHGMKVAILDVQPPNDRTKDLSNISYFKCNVSKQNEVTSVAETIRSTLGTPSILINNAGIGKPYLILNLPPGRVNEVLSVNIMSHFYTLQEFLPDMIKRKKGHVMAVASLASFVSGATMSSYASSKAAMLALYESLDQELKHFYQAPEIKTSIVYPNFTSTKLIADFEEKLKKGGRPVPLLDPKDVAAVMVKQILSGKSGQLFIPESSGVLAPLVRGLPTWLQEFLRDSIVRGEVTSGLDQ